MNKNPQNLMQNEDSFTVDNKGKLINTLDSITLKTVSGNDVSDLKKIVSGNTVKLAIDALVNNINEQFINKLNIMLEKEQAKVKSLEDIIGNDNAGLKKDLSELTGRVNSILPEEAPTHPDIL